MFGEHLAWPELAAKTENAMREIDIDPICPTVEGAHCVLTPLLKKLDIPSCREAHSSLPAIDSGRESSP